MAVWLGKKGGVCNVDQVKLLRILMFLKLYTWREVNKWLSVIIETNAAEVFHCFHSKETRDWQLSPLSEEFKASRGFFQKLKLNLLQRKTSTYADWVASRSKMEICPVDWVFRPPFSLICGLRIVLLSVYCTHGFFGNYNDHG